MAGFRAFFGEHFSKRVILLGGFFVGKILLETFLRWIQARLFGKFFQGYFWSAFMGSIYLKSF